MRRPAVAAVLRPYAVAGAAAAMLLLVGCTEQATERAAPTVTEAPETAPQPASQPEPVDLGIDAASDSPLYARLSVSEDGSRVMVLMLDESGGADSGYDTLYADTNFDGKLDPDERLETTESEDYDNFMVAQFAPIELPADDADSSQPRTVDLVYMGNPDEGMNLLRASLALQASGEAGAERPMCMLSGELALATTPDEATVWRCAGEPSLEIQTKPLEGRELGVALVAKVGDAELWSSETEVDVVIRTAAGQVVNRDHGYLSDFGFG